METSLINRYARLALFALAFNACAPNQPGLNIKKNGGNLGAQDGPEVPDNIQFMNARYVTVANALGFKMCDGAIQFEVNLAAKGGNTTNLFRIPEGRLKCSSLGGLGDGNGEIDLARLMGGFNAPGNQGASPVQIVDDVISLSTLGAGSYSPGRPFLPNFVGATPEVLRKLNVTKQLTIRDLKTGATSQGTANLRVLEHGGRYRPGKLSFSHEFKNVLVFELKHTGFNEVQIMNHMLWDRFKMYISLEPFAILRIEMDATVADALASSQDPAAANKKLEDGISGFTRGIGSMIFGPFGGAAGDIAGKLIADGIKKGTVQVVMDIATMDQLKEMVDRIGNTSNGPSSGGRAIK
ncbi:MAG: hypothetical protein RIQ81_2095 [Pseudomonadota bacterium]|jgi:hypothetical protein